MPLPSLRQASTAEVEAALNFATSQCWVRLTLVMLSALLLSLRSRCSRRNGQKLEHTRRKIQLFKILTCILGFRGQELELLKMLYEKPKSFFFFPQPRFPVIAVAARRGILRT